MRRSGLAAGLGLAVIALFLPGNAFGAVAALEREGGATGFDSTNKGIAAGCPPGKRVLGAGADLGSGSGQVSIDSVFPSDAALTTVLVSGEEDENGFAGAWSVGVTAICATPVPGLQRVQVTSAFNSANKNVTATCPAGKRLLGTGYDVSNGFGQVTTEALVPNPGLTAVSVRAVEDQSGYVASWAVQVYAICANPIAGVQLVTARSATNSTNGKSATATCPAGKQVTGVGGDIRGAGGQVVMDDLIPFPDPALSVQVVGQEDEDGTTASWSAGAYAICAPASERVVATSATDSSDSKHAGADCPAGKTISGGGFDINGAVGQVSVDALIPVIGHAGLGVDAARDQSGAVTTWNVRAHAICAPRRPGFEDISAISASTSGNKGVFASCSPGKKVVGVIGHVTGAPGELALTQITPLANMTQVFVAAVETEFGTAASWSVTARALCAIPPPGLELVSATSELGSDPVSAVATCPAGKNLIGAGGAQPTGSAVLDDMRPDANLTSVTATGIEQIATATEWTVTAHAICANP